MGSCTEWDNRSGTSVGQKARTKGDRVQDKRVPCYVFRRLELGPEKSHNDAGSTSFPYCTLLCEGPRRVRQVVTWDLGE